MTAVVAGRSSKSYAERRAERAEVDDPQVVLDAGARFLEARPRSVTEVRRRLSSAGYRSELVDGAVDRLLDLGVLDDEAFARAWVESRDRARPRGERAIRDELRLKGIDRTTVDLVLGERREAVAPADDGSVGDSPDRTAAERLIRKHARALARIVDPRQRRQRAYALLARNGFDPETCRDVAATLGDVDDTGEGDPG